MFVHPVALRALISRRELDRSGGNGEARDALGNGRLPFLNFPSHGVNPKAAERHPSP
jgi:hypothetical protein